MLVGDGSISSPRRLLLASSRSLMVEGAVGFSIISSVNKIRTGVRIILPHRNLNCVNNFSKGKARTCVPPLQNDDSHKFLWVSNLDEIGHSALQIKVNAGVVSE